MQAGTLPKATLDVIVKEAALKLRGKKSWTGVRGPAGGLFMTTERIHWSRVDGTTIRDESGRLIDLGSVDLKTLQFWAKQAEQTPCTLR